MGWGCPDHLSHKTHDMMLLRVVWTCINWKHYRLQFQNWNRLYRILIFHSFFMDNHRHLIFFYAYSFFADFKMHDWSSTGIGPNIDVQPFLDETRQKYSCIVFLLLLFLVSSDVGGTWSLTKFLPSHHNDQISKTFDKKCNASCFEKGIYLTFNRLNSLLSCISFLGLYQRYMIFE